METLGIINFGAFLVAAILLNMTPGVDTLYVLGRSLTGGTRVGIVSALGISTGLLVHTILVALGLSVVLMSSEWLFWAVKLLGACYLVYLGIRALIGSKKALAIEPDEGVSEGKQGATSSKALRLGRSYVQGVITNVANPKCALFFLAFLPQFVDPSTTLGPLPFLILGLSFIVTSTLWSFVLAVGAGQFKRFLDKRPRVSGMVNKGAGVLYIILGISIFATPLPE